MPTEATENYLAEILRLEESGTPATTGALADRLGVARPSVTGMLKKLARDDLVSRRPYQDAQLTPRGRRIAQRMLRRHRLVEMFLVDTLGLEPDRVHAEAHRIEHALSDEVVDRLDDWLGNPTVDPHGTPIPPRDSGDAGSVPTRRDSALKEDDS